MNTSHFIDFGPTCWNNRTIITEARTKRSDSDSMDDLLRKAILANFKEARKRPHVSISPDSQRYKERRISKARLEAGLSNRWDSVASTEPYSWIYFSFLVSFSLRIFWISQFSSAK